MSQFDDSLKDAGRSPSSVTAESQHGKWIAVVPMHNLKISDDPPINGQWRVGSVTFMSGDRLESYLQPPILTQTLNPNSWSLVSRDSMSSAVVSLNGTPNELRRVIFRKLRDASNILAATAAFYGNRYHSCGFHLKGYPHHTKKHCCFVQSDGTAFSGGWEQRGMLMPFNLDLAWHNAIEQIGIINLFDRLDDDSLDQDWRRQIASGAAMLGRSMMSLELADAFLLNVIGLETLLTRRNERNGRVLFKRIKGMTGWHLRAARPNYEAEIRAIHSIRCAIVHDSDYSELTTERLLQSDVYLANSLMNIVRFPAVFPNKNTLASKLDGFADNENWPEDGSIPFRWFGNSQFDPEDLELQLW